MTTILRAKSSGTLFLVGNRLKYVKDTIHLMHKKKNSVLSEGVFLLDLGRLKR